MGVVGIYVRYLPEDIGAQVRHLASDADLETLYAAGKFAADREDRRTALTLLRDAGDLAMVSRRVTGLLTFTGELLSGSRDPAFVDRQSRAPAMPYPQPWTSTDPARHSMRKARDRRFGTVDERDFLIGMHGRRCLRHASHRHHMSPGRGTVLRMFRQGTNGTRHPEVVQAIGATPRTRARRHGGRPT